MSQELEDLLGKILELRGTPHRLDNPDDRWFEVANKKIGVRFSSHQRPGESPTYFVEWRREKVYEWVYSSLIRDGKHEVTRYTRGPWEEKLHHYLRPIPDPSKTDPNQQLLPFLQDSK